VRFIDRWGFAPGGHPVVDVLGSDGIERRVPVVVHRSATEVDATFPTQPEAVAVRIGDPLGFRLSGTVLAPAHGPPVVLSTAMQLGLDTPTWRFAGIHGPLNFFTATKVRRAAWFARGDRAGTVTSTSTTQTGQATVSVSTPGPGILVRSESWLPGWTATMRSTDGQTRSAAVVPHGLVQSVAVPPGRWTVTFSYHAPHVLAGIVTSLAALAALLAGVAWLVLDRRARRIAPTTT
jgi:hypothetical protein